MNPGPIEESAKVATGVIDALKSSPLLLGILLLNALIFVVLYFIAADNRARQHQLVQHLLDNQVKLQDMIAHCRDPVPPRSDLPIVHPPG